MEERTAVITLRIEQSHKAAFERLAAELDQTTSQMLRRYIRHAIKEHAEAKGQGQLDLHPEEAAAAPTKKPAKGQKLAAACAKTARGGK